MNRLVLLVTSPRVAPGLLSAEAWTAVLAGPVVVRDPALPSVAPLRAAGVEIEVWEQEPGDWSEFAVDLVAASRIGSTTTWLVGAETEAEVAEVIKVITSQISAADDSLEFDVIHGSWDLPGARLLDVVATMDRLRSPGGCPWDAQQDHASLAPYLLEEAYEAFQTLEDNDLAGLKSELGDVLLQVAFHARLAEELPAAERWSIDDVATGLVEKLVRRHPHVFADVAVVGADEVNANWEVIKAAERGDVSPLANVPMAAPALTLAATLQRKAVRAGLAVADALQPDLALRQFSENPSTAVAGELLWTIVDLMRANGIDAEAALRSRARSFRDAADPTAR